ncbi:MAG: hypothetical protein QOE10_517 [Gaiellales bacterium]|nr:hypothetical protein [Gaiellales bacterium]
MRKHLLDLIVLFVIASAVAISVALVQPGAHDVILRAYVLTIGGLVMLAVLAATAESVPRRRRSELDRALTEVVRGDEQLHEVARIERQVTLGTATAYDLHVRLLPQLRQIAQSRLERTGRSMSPETLGRWWELLRPDRAAPDNRHGAGISAGELRELVSDLERM